MTISETIKYVGVNDHRIDLFEGQYPVPNGMAYNSYVVIDDKVAVMDSVDANFADEWLDNISVVLGERIPDYLIVQHMEPDHSGGIKRFLSAYPDAKVVSSARAFTMMQNFFGENFSDRSITVNEGDTLSLGGRELSFISAPMVHWPEVTMTYDSKEKVLFSADAFGKFGALDVSEDWTGEARRYYIGIVGKYGVQVQNVLKKAAALDIKTICPLHGPVLSDDLGYYLDLYDKWSSYTPEEEGVLIAYTSVYGNTKKAALRLAELLEENKANVIVRDLARSEMSEVVGEAFRYSHVVLATTTYNGDIFPFMKEFIDHLTERNFSNRTVAFIENGSWAPIAARIMRTMLEKSKGITFANTVVKIFSAPNGENEAQLAALAKELCSEESASTTDAANAPAGKRYVCKVCGYIHEGDLPEGFVCPLCKRGTDAFEELV